MREDTLIWSKLIWLVIVVLVLTGVIAHMVFVIQTYTKYPSQETTKLLNKSPHFPYLTICNALPISFNHSTEVSVDSSTEFARYVQLMADMGDELEDYENRTGNSIDDILLSPLGIYANIERDEIIEIGHSLKDLVRGCKYLAEDCNMEEHWEHFVDSEYFNCYTFTGGAKSDKSATGPTNGFSVVLYMENLVPLSYNRDESYNIYSNIQNSFGLRVDIHDEGTLPTLIDTGIDIMPGHSTSIALKANKIHKLPQPWDDCTNKDRLDGLDEYRYSTEGCFTECLTKFVYDKCDCVVNYSPTPHSIPSETKHCLFMDNVTVTLADYDDIANCVFRAYTKFNTNEKVREKCNCKEPCAYRTYDKEISENIWPAHIYQFDAFTEFAIETEDHESLLAYNQMWDTFVDAQNGATDGTLFKEMMFSNFARINIYFKSQTVLERKQTASMTLTDLFANVGGTIGLWAGLSVVTVIEVFSLLIRIVRILVTRCEKMRDQKEELETIMKHQHENLSLIACM